MQSQLMQKLFTRILIPVDFSRQSGKVIEKAVKIAIQYNCSIQLLNVYTGIPFKADAMSGDYYVMQRKIRNNESKLKIEMEKLCEQIKGLSGGKIIANYSILPGTWNEVIVDFIAQDKYDLVLVAKKTGLAGESSMLLNTDIIASKSNVPVITLPVKWNMAHLNAVVIPVTDFLPVRKLIYGIYLANEFKASIKLLGVSGSDDFEKVNYYLQKASALINENCRISVETSVMREDNIEKAVNKFTQKKTAGLLILNPGTVTRVPGFFENLFGNILNRHPAPPVLTINSI